MSCCLDNTCTTIATTSLIHTYTEGYTEGTQECRGASIRMTALGKLSGDGSVSRESPQRTFVQMAKDYLLDSTLHSNITDSKSVSRSNFEINLVAKLPFSSAICFHPCVARFSTNRKASIEISDQCNVHTRT